MLESYRVAPFQPRLSTFSDVIIVSGYYDTVDTHIPKVVTVLVELVTTLVTDYYYCGMTMLKITNDWTGCQQLVSYSLRLLPQ